MSPRDPSTFLAINPGHAHVPGDYVDDDDTCPDCKGECVDSSGFDCVRCAGDGVVDE